MITTMATFMVRVADSTKEMTMNSELFESRQITNYRELLRLKGHLAASIYLEMELSTDEDGNYVGSAQRLFIDIGGGHKYCTFDYGTFEHALYALERSNYDWLHINRPLSTAPDEVQIWEINHCARPAKRVSGGLN